MNSSTSMLRPETRALLGWALLAVALAIYFFVPVSAVLDTSLDASNYASYNRFAAQQLQFGTEVVPMAGPFGYVFYGWVYHSDLYITRLALEFVTKLVLGMLVLWFFRRTRDPITGWAWLLGNLLVLPTTGELTYDLPVLYAALFLVFERPRWPLSLAIVSFLAFLALCKGTQLIFTLAVLAVVGLEAAWRRAWRELVVILLGFFSALMVLWVLAGQHLNNLPAYIRNIQELSAGYVSGMALQETRLTFAVGLALFVITSISLLLLLVRHRRESKYVAAVVVLAGFTFLQWKHGFVRADGHVFLFFHYCIVGALTILALERPDNRSLHVASARSALCVAAIALALYGDGQRIGIRFREYGNVLVHHVPHAVRQIFHPAADRERFERMLAKNRVRFALPETVDRVQRSTIGFFGYQSGYLELNGLNERPSPVAGGGPFSVFTPHLQKLNERHVLSPATRPDFYLLKLQTIDGRYIPQDDARSLNALLHSYRPVLAERGMLLSKLAPAHTPPPLRQLNHVSFKLSEEIAVPRVGSNEMLLAALTLPSSPAGSLRSALYKSAIVTLRLTAADSSRALTRRIIPSMASAPFIVSPMIDATEDLLAIYSPGEGRVPQTLLVTADPADALASDRCSVTFYVQPRPTALEPAAIKELSEQFSYPVANRAPVKVEAANSPVKEVDGRVVQLLEPPGEIVFNLQGDERELLFDYGFDPEAYTRGTTDGADFITELILPDGTPEQIFLSRREPRSTPHDQGRHHAKLWLPVLQPGMSLRLRTTGGVRGAADWDWTFYDNIRLHRGPLNLAQFPGFRVAPSGVEGASPRMIEHENRDVLLLNAPGQLIFNLDGTERSLRFVGGLIPGAYTEGNSDGVDFTVEVQHPDGRTESLFQRWLQPKASPPDRGIQTFDVSLGAQPAGSQLIIRTSPGPNNDPSWDWSYVGGVHLMQSGEG